MAKNVEYAVLLGFYASALTEKQREIAELYYYEDLSLSEISENCGISRQGARDAIKRSEEVLRDLENKIGYAAWYRNVETAVAEIRKATTLIRKTNTQFFHSVDVDVALKTIDRNLRELEKEEDSGGI